MSYLLAHRIIKAHRNGTDFHIKRAAREAIRSERVQSIIEAVKQLQEDRTRVWSTKQVCAEVERSGGLKVSPQLAARVLRQHFGFSYQRLVGTAFLSNSDRSLVLRLRFARMMLPMLASGKRIINVDESSIPFLDFHRRCWAKRGVKNTMSVKDLTQKVNMIAAIDTEGRSYVALTQINTDSEVMVCFLVKLCSLLTQEDKNWRQNTVIMLDGAKYHRSIETRSALQKLGVSFVITSPYSYDAAPVERFFSYFKRTQLNPEHLPTGKT